MIKVILVIMLVLAVIVAVAAYWMLKPVETGWISTANTSGSVNMSNYYGYQETVNYWPVLGWIALIAVILGAGYFVVKGHFD